MSDKSGQPQEPTIRFNNLSLSLVAHDYAIEEIIIPVAEKFITSNDNLKSSFDIKMKVAVMTGLIKTAKVHQAMFKAIRQLFLEEYTEEDFQKPGGEKLVAELERQVAGQIQESGRYLWDSVSPVKTGKEEHWEFMTTLYDYEKLTDASDFVKDMLEFHAEDREPI